jgi:hypothetical protein
MTETIFRTIQPKILYFGTPVALISSLNKEGDTNLAPISSFWALGWTMLLGLLDEDGGQSAAASGVRRKPSIAGDVGARGKARPVDGKESSAGDQSEAISFRAVQVSGCGTDAACERSPKTHARERMPSSSGGVRHQDARIVRGPICSSSPAESRRKWKWSGCTSPAISWLRTTTSTPRSGRR